MALADAGAHGGAVLVAGGDGQQHAVVSDAVQDFRNALLTLGGAEAAGGAQAHVDHVRPQGHGIVRRRQDVVPGGAVGAAGAEHLHGQDLGLGGRAHHVAHHTGVGRRDAGYVDAVVTGIAGVHVQVIVRVVEGKGHLGGVVDLAGGDGFLLLRVQRFAGQDRFNVRFRQGRAGGSRRKALVADLQAGVQNGDDHALALVAGAVFQAAQLRGGGLHVRGHLEFRRRIGGGHTGQGPDLVQLAVGHLDGEAVGGRRVGVQDLHRLAIQDLAGDLLLHRRLLAQHHGPVPDLAAASAALRHHRLCLQGDDGGDLLQRVNGVGGFQGLQAGVLQLLHPFGAAGRLLGRSVVGKGRHVGGDQHNGRQQQGKNTMFLQCLNSLIQSSSFGPSPRASFKFVSSSPCGIRIIQPLSRSTAGLPAGRWQGFSSLCRSCPGVRRI